MQREKPYEPPEVATMPSTGRATRSMVTTMLVIVAVSAVAATLVLFVMRLSIADELDATRQDLGAARDRGEALSVERDELNKQLGLLTERNERLSEKNQGLAEKSNLLSDNLDGCHKFMRASVEAFERFGFAATEAQVASVMGTEGVNELSACFGGRIPTWLGP
jgi:hypothetical protein